METRALWLPALGGVAFALTGDESRERTWVSLIDLANGVQASESLGDIRKRAGLTTRWISASAR